MAAIASTRARRLIHENAHAPHARRNDLRRALGRDVPRAFDIEVESNGVAPPAMAAAASSAVGDAADLEDHAATSFLMAAAGSSDFMRCSPTRNAV